MSFGSYLAGAVEMLVVIAALGYGAVRLRARFLDGWSGARARLAEIVLALSLLVISLELIGVVGLYRPGWVLIGTVAAGVGAGLWASRGEGGRLAALPAPPLSAVAVAVAVGASMLVAAHWAMPTQTGLEIGMYLPNTTWHNAPFAARFVQDAQVGALHMTEVLKLTVWFYPQNSELLHSFGILFLGSDFLSPLINIGWMCLCLLAAWCFGRPYGAAATALLGVAILLDAELLLLYQPGDAKNDVGGLFFLLAAAAILVNGEAQSRAATQAARPTRGFVDTGVGLTPIFPRGALIVAGLAAGLALGTKLNLLAPFGLLTLGVIAIARPGDRLRTASIWVGASLATGGFWFARNLLDAGNPLPWADAGPLSGPEQLEIDIREPHTVADYLTNIDVITDSFIPGLNDSFGVLWPLVLAAVAGGFVLAIWRGRTSMLRMLGVVALLSGIAYLFTPLTAAGPLNEPSAFEVNLRYSTPCLALGALLLSVDPALTREGARRALMGGLAGLLLVGLVSGGEDVWDRDFLPGAVILALLLVAIPAGLALAPRLGIDRRIVAAGAAVAIVLAIGVGWLRSDAFLDDRYRAETAPDDFPQGITTALAWFNEEQPSDARIAVVGGRPGFKQYVFYGDDLSNRVQYVAHHGERGAYVPITSCEEWREALNEGDYDYAVIGPDQRTQSESPIEAEWTGADDAAAKLVEDDMIFVFEITGELDPASCAELDALDYGGPMPTEP
ncbi:MAG: hypothetical protein M3O25_07345 [Actinomycetota bacterium]|nr:hypothetical protein [Actinomycetota bacterium]